MYVCMYVCTYVRMYVCMCVCVCVCMYVCMYVYMYVYVCMCVCVRTHTASRHVTKLAEVYARLKQNQIQHDMFELDAKLKITLQE
jgi:hypothetical protein